MNTSLDFKLQADARALDWLARDRDRVPLVIAYSETRCCGGGKICQVRIRSRKRAERLELVEIGQLAGRTVWLDRRIARRLPRRLPLTVHGIGPFKALSLDLEGEQWAALLYA